MSQNNGSDSHSTICFSSTQAFTLPIETWFLVRENCTKNEMQVTLCILLNYYQVGIESQPLTFGDIHEQTGMGKASVFRGLEAAIGRGSILRTAVNGQTRYEPRFQKNGTHDMYYLSSQSKQTPKTKNTCHGSELKPRTEIFEQLLKYGLAYHVAENIALTNRYPLEQLRTQISYIDYELENALCPKRPSAIPGYVVNRIKYNRVKPPEMDELDDLWMR